jgi:nucleoside-diphosphate-sugar epimerase
MEHPNAAGQTFLISDGEDLSTPELILLIASAMGQPIKLFSIPKSILKFLGFILGKQKEMCRITESLQIDNSYAKQILNWTPPVSVKEGIRRMIKGK